MKEKKKNKYLEVTILLIIIATISCIILLGHNYLKNENTISNASKLDNYSQTKINRYQVILNNINNYQIPLKGYIDTRNSSYYIFVESTDNIINKVYEIINIEYFDPTIYSYDEITSINQEAIKINNALINNPIPTEEPTIETKPTEDLDNIKNQQETDEPNTEKNDEPTETPNNPPVENHSSINQEITINEQNLSSIYPLNWLDYNNISYEDFNMDTLTNYCNGYNDIDSYYTTTCTKTNLHLKLSNSFNINSINGFVFNTKRLTINLPVKRGTKLSDFNKELKNKGIKLELVNKIE